VASGGRLDGGHSNHPGGRKRARDSVDPSDQDALELALDDPAVILVLLEGDAPVGYVRPPAMARRRGRASSTATCQVRLSEPGTALAVHSAGADHPVTVVSEPRFDPEMARLKDVAGAARS
jgi:glycine cleavage system aminomethyltransferase T